VREFFDAQVANLVENRCFHNDVSPLFLGEPCLRPVNSVAGPRFARLSGTRQPIKHVGGCQALWRVVLGGVDCKRVLTPSYPAD
jgi:hypothetical protein